ncbi:hypothetical protein PCANC_28260, partial [Puccinia coronata f. sp. avenae]
MDPDGETLWCMTKYKPVAKKVRPVNQAMPQSINPPLQRPPLTRNPYQTPLTPHPPDFTPTWKVTEGGLIAARPKGVRTPPQTPKKKGVRGLHAFFLGVQSPARHPPHAARHVHAYNRRAHGQQACGRARRACRACTPVWKACKACTPFGRACRLCTPVAHVSLSIREAYVSRGTLIRVPRYPYKGTSRTLIRVPGTRSTLIRVLRTLIAGLTSASRFERLT